MTILYVDDDSDDREIFGAAINLIDPRVQYSEFEAGETIIDFLNSERVKPDYIFIDINMPKMNGYECAQEIISANMIESARIVMYSTTFNSSDAERFGRMGVQMLQKADTFDQLIKNLRYLFSRDQAHAAFA